MKNTRKIVVIFLILMMLLGTVLTMLLGILQSSARY